MAIVENTIREKVQRKGIRSLDSLEWDIWVSMHRLNLPYLSRKEVMCPSCGHHVDVVMIENRGLIDGKQSEVWYILACGHAVKKEVE